MIAQLVGPVAAPAKRPLRALEPQDPFLRAAMVGVRARGGDLFQRRDWLRVSYRLAAGMSVPQVARTEGKEEAAIEDLLAQEDFRGLVESQKALEALPEEEQTERLVRLARIAIENALSDLDLGAAYFVLREHGQGRDPARTVARTIMGKARRAAAAPPAPPPAPLGPPAAPGAPRRRPYDPLDALVHRQTAALRRAVVEEHAVCHAAVAADVSPTGAAATRAAAGRALALKRKAASAPPPSDHAGRHHAGDPDALPALGSTPAEPFPAAAFPRRPRAP